MTQKVPVIPAISADVPLNTRRVLLAMKTTIEYLLTQTGDLSMQATSSTPTGGGSGGTSTHNALNALQGGSTNSYFHLTEAQHTDLLDGGPSTAHYHAADRDLANHTGLLPWANVDKTGAVIGDFGSFNHEDLSLIQGGAVGEHYHLTTAEWAFLLQGTDTVLHFHASDRALTNATGVLPWGQVDKTGSLHNEIETIQGGTADEYYHLTSAEHTELQRADNVASIAVNTTLDDANRTILVTASGVVVTLPAASAARVGKDWTVIFGTVGFIDITTSGADTINLPVVSDTIRLRTKGATATLRCTTATSWGIV